MHSLFSNPWEPQRYRRYLKGTLDYWKVFGYIFDDDLVFFGRQSKENWERRSEGSKEWILDGAEWQKTC